MGGSKVSRRWALGRRRRQHAKIESVPVFKKCQVSPSTMPTRHRPLGAAYVASSSEETNSAAHSHVSPCPRCQTAFACNDHRTTQSTGRSRRVAATIDAFLSDASKVGNRCARLMISVPVERRAVAEGFDTRRGALARLGFTRGPWAQATSKVVSHPKFADTRLSLPPRERARLQIYRAPNAEARGPRRRRLPPWRCPD